MGAILDKVGAPDLVKRFVGLLSSNRRLFAIKEIISDYLVLLSRRREEVTAEVTSAVPLSDKQTAKLKRMLRNSMGNAVSLNTSLDPSLLGGLIIKIGSRMIDSSLRNKLQQLRSVHYSLSIA